MHPPRVAGLVVRAAVPEPHREFLLGDLDEQFDEWVDPVKMTEPGL